MSRHQDDVGKVREAMNCFPEGGTKTDLKSKTGLRTARIDAALVALVNDGVVERCKVVKDNRQGYDGYRLAAGTAA